MDLQLLEALVREGLTSLNLDVEGHLHEGDPTVRIIDRAHPPRLVGVITDHRSDHFSLRVDGYGFHDTDYSEEGQEALVGDFCKIVAAYLRGEGTESQGRRLLGRSGPTYTLEVGGRTWTSTIRKT